MGTRKFELKIAQPFIYRLHNVRLRDDILYQNHPAFLKGELEP